VRVFNYGDPAAPRVAVATNDHPVDLRAALGALAAEEADDDLQEKFASTEALIAGGPEVWRAAARVVDAGAHLEQAHVASDAHWLAPLKPRSLRDFLAFEDHVVRGARRRGGEVPEYWYEAPVYYKGNHRSIIGPDEECPWPPYTQRLDFELELAMIVGRSGRDVSQEAAPEHVFGFTIFNDFSARDIQAKEMSAWLGPAKGKDFANALGPCIVTADEVGTHPELEMTCRVNGEAWGRARSSTARWSWAEMIAHVSAGEAIEPGDVYGSGTPGGCCGLDLGRELEPGDVVELEIERIGVLRNRIGARPSG
jgi:2-keto-4-pentenoate hydratase/2-oxohepta-3-ene-1,7-dioic acid hydratase in catechol pathway